MEKKKIQLKKVPEAVWFAVFLAAVCAAAGAEEIDGWTAVTRMNQITGTWKGTTVVVEPSTEKQVMPDMRMTMTITLRYTEDAEDMEMAMKLDLSQFLSDWSAFIGISEGALWEILSMSLRDGQTEDDEAFEIGAYFISVSKYVPVDAVIEDNAALFINADGTKLKLQLDGLSSSDINNFVSPALISAFILYRQ